MAQNGTRHMIDWNQLVLTCRRYAPLATVAKECGVNYQTLGHISRWEQAEPRFSSGMRLIAWAGARFTEEELARCRRG